MKKKIDKKQSREIKQKIWEMLQAGSSQAAAARATGTTRQYVHVLAKDFETRGYERVEASLGRPFDEPVTPEENRIIFETLLNKTPREAGIDADAWTRSPLQEWFKKEFGRHLSRNQVRRFCTENDIDIEPEPTGYPWIDEHFDDTPSGVPTRTYQAKKDPHPTGQRTVRKTVAKPRSKVPGTSRPTFPKKTSETPDQPRRRTGRPRKGEGEMDLEAIQRSVEETQKKLTKQQIDALYGKKSGKHSKGKRTPFTPSRKKKKKKKK
ncbi:MAG: hypothetical protein LAT55_01465 [Opitutales bacterium]|nr:hypothetical protein [Opitutales bacterium]